VTKWTPLHWLSRYGDQKLCELLVNNGAIPCVPDNDGYFPIDYAGKFQMASTVEFLVKLSIQKFKEIQQGIVQQQSLDFSKFSSPSFQKENLF
jgi:ankyrin repeat protein